MSKLFSLKEWLTLEDAASYLKTAFKEDVTPAHILQMAIDGNLVISVYLVNPVDVITGKVVPKNQFIGRSNDVLKNGDVLVFGEEISRISGIFDLPMIGGEVRDCEQKLQELIKGPIVTSGHPRGAYIRDFKSENYYQILAYFSDKGEQLWGWPYGPESDGSVRLKSRLFQKSFIAKHLEQGGDLKDLKIQPTNDDLFVVRTSVLRDFIDSNNRKDDDKPLGTTERNTLLKIIGALVKEMERKDASAAKTSGYIARLTDLMGDSVSVRTIDDVLMKISKAAKSRS